MIAFVYERRVACHLSATTLKGYGITFHVAWDVQDDSRDAVFFPRCL